MRASPTPVRPSSVRTVTNVRFRHGVPRTWVPISVMRNAPPSQINLALACVSANIQGVGESLPSARRVSAAAGPHGRALPHHQLRFDAAARRRTGAVPAGVVDALQQQLEGVPPDLA